MGFWDFFRRKKQEEKLEKKKISFLEITSWISAYKSKNKEKEKKFLGIVKNRIFKLADELEEEAEVLENLDLTEKREQEKIKLVVRENLNKYAYYVRKLAETLKALETGEPSEFIEKINQIFYDFDRKSTISYQKATILIGKEIAEVGKSIAKFSEDLKDTIDENKETLENSKILKIIEKKLEELDSLEKIKAETESNLGKYSEKIIGIEKKDKKIEKKIEEIKESPEYIEIKRKERQISEKEENLKTEIYKLKSLIDFKLLASLYHSNEKEMKIINEYKNNFLESFEKDLGNGIIELIENLGIENKEAIIKKINEITLEKKKLTSSSIEKDPVDYLFSELRKNITEIESINLEKAKEEKRNEKIKEAEKELKEIIKKELEKLGMEVE